MIKTMLKSGAFACCLMLPVTVTATPLFDTFGPLSEANFGGTGIPNDEVAVSQQFSNGTTKITVAMSATQRYTNPALTNDGAGTYYATAGTSIEGPDPGSEGALWNFNYYIEVSGSDETLADYDFTLFYDFNPDFDNGPADLGTIDVNDGISIKGGDPSAMNLVQGSQNLLFGFLATDFLGIVTAPTDILSFDPDALGEYNFGISVSQAGWGVENVRMDVQVVPVPAAAWLFGSAVLGLATVARRKKS